eukprot:bmy_17417T0
MPRGVPLRDYISQSVSRAIPPSWRPLSPTSSGLQLPQCSAAKLPPPEAPDPLHVSCRSAGTDMAAEKDQQKDAEVEGLSATTLLPKLIPSGAGREWLERRRATIRPWGSFVDQRRFSRPRNLGELCQRLVRNVEYYQSNYVFVFLGLILYCVLVGWGSQGLLWERARVSEQLPQCRLPPGREVTPAHQYALAGTVSFPFFWLAGAGSAVFWVLGATLVVIGSHAAFHQVEAMDGEELQMEPV